MLKLTGDLWEWHRRGLWAVIPTNVGWKTNGDNPMGAGVALQAAQKFSGLPAWYGAKCKKYGKNLAVQPYLTAKLLLFPTKPLDEAQPWLSWRNPSCPVLINRGLVQLRYMFDSGMFHGQVAIPLVGCGMGGLSRDEVVPMMEAYLDDRFTLVEPVVPR